MTLRPAVVPPNRGFLVGAWIGGSALVVSIAAAVIMRMPDAPPAPVAKVTVAPAAPVVVPVPITIMPPAPPPPPPSPAEPEPPPIRAARPFLQAACVLPDGEAASCTWDRGFPAISEDGQTIVREAIADDGGRGHPNLAIEFVDVATSKVTKSVLILDANEYDPEHQQLTARIGKRVAAAQKLIAAGGYRSLLPLARLDDPTGGTLRVEPNGGAVRIIDTEKRLAIFQASFEASVVAPDHKDDAERECSGLSAHEPSVWFDEHTRIALVTVDYTYGGCMCGSETRVFVTRVP